MRSRVEAWLQYGNELGLGPYFVARPESVVLSRPAPDLIQASVPR